MNTDPITAARESMQPFVEAAQRLMDQAFTPTHIQRAAIAKFLQGEADSATAPLREALTQARAYHNGECREFLGTGKCNCWIMSVGVKDAAKYDTLVRKLREEVERLKKLNPVWHYSIKQEQFLTDKERDENGQFGPEWGEIESKTWMEWETQRARKAMDEQSRASDKRLIQDLSRVMAEQRKRAEQAERERDERNAVLRAEVERLQQVLLTEISRAEIAFAEAKLWDKVRANQRATIVFLRTRLDAMTRALEKQHRWHLDQTERSPVFFGDTIGQVNAEEYQDSELYTVTENALRADPKPEDTDTARLDSPAPACETVTPRVDAEWATNEYSEPVVSADFASQLERELTAALAERDEAKREVYMPPTFAIHMERDRAITERDAALRELAEAKADTRRLVETVKNGLTEWGEYYERELESTDRWAKWCANECDMYGNNFYEGLRSGLVNTDISLSKLKKALRAALDSALSREGKA